MLIDRVELYWILKLDDIWGGLMCFCCIFATAAIIFLFVFLETKRNIYKLHIAIFSIFAITIIAAMTLIPSTKQMATILVLPSIINNEQVQQLPHEIIDLSMEWIEELRPPKDEVKQ